MGEELALRGAEVVFADLSWEMVREAPAPRVVGDITALGLRSAAFDLATAGSVLSHVDDPRRALAELVRVTRPGGMVAVTAFPAGDRHPVKEAVSAVLDGFGYVPPAWYERLKRTGEARVGDPVALAALGGAAGLQAVRLRRLAAPLTGLNPWSVVAWRLGMAQVAPFRARLSPPERERLTAAALAAVEGVGLAEPVRLMLLTGEVP
jgi:SAM-dependent methyltransferase